MAESSASEVDPADPLNVDADADANVDTPAHGSRCQFKTYRHGRRKDGRASVEEELDAFQLSEHHDDDASYALVIRRHFTDKHELESVVVRINSPEILAAFREVIGAYPTVAADFTTPFELTSPFPMLIHEWDRLDAHRKETDDPVRRMHLNLLFRFMEHEIGHERETLLAMMRNRKITYKQAWALFRPGGLVITEVMKKPWLLRVERTTYEISTSVGPYFTVYVSYCDANDKAVGEAETSFVILQKTYFGSEHPSRIDSLPIYPREFHRRGDDLEAELKARGQKFVENRGILTRDYDGLAQYLKDPPWDYFHPGMADFGAIWVPFTETGRIVLDRKTFEEDNFDRHVKVQEQDEPELMLCPPYSIGFSLDRKEWCRYLVDNLREVTWKDDAWKSLILDEEEKTVLQALVTSHRYPGNARNQPEQKGKGLVILLHGTPGSGKTLSAETSAEMSRKALLSASLGDLNKFNVPWAFERKLKQVLQYATLWEAVVLLDEADVFLEAREAGAGASTGDKGSTARNALVAVFLKELEYFSGIVFLTTNRLASFDAAMKSRVHLSLRFAPPGVETRRRIWRQNLAAVPAEETSIGEGAAVDEATEILLQYDLNGREICNALNTARTIARFEGVPLGVPHVQRVLKVRTTFDKHLVEETRRLERKGRKEGREGPAAFRLIKRDSILSQYDEDDDE
ncbi:P-loop containing nucleoside triphosphate hydrolase protein [Plectosphaerella plurivora]|uniref:P-loop containing nucleoside triphosphate hydrolase protein n=1 Tax=Plectosphaerella plurivora TaxID=936078 RepID=A0A9P8V7F8_9PEZI|nr:P-loop containing nucleoside triphosphate hydrolase protein [Plectosphaerella plurivora]